VGKSKSRKAVDALRTLFLIPGGRAGGINTRRDGFNFAREVGFLTGLVVRLTGLESTTRVFLVLADFGIGFVFLETDLATGGFTFALEEVVEVDDFVFGFSGIVFFAFEEAGTGFGVTEKVAIGKKINTVLRR
jgi:hypothetical protein